MERSQNSGVRIQEKSSLVLSARQRKRALLLLLALSVALALACSPEASRARGGGSGADVGNRPSKSSEVNIHAGNNPSYKAPGDKGFPR